MLVTFLYGAGVGLAVAAGIIATVAGLSLATGWIAKMICGDPYWAEQIKPLVFFTLTLVFGFSLFGGVAAVLAS